MGLGRIGGLGCVCGPGLGFGVDLTGPTYGVLLKTWDGPGCWWAWVCSWIRGAWDWVGLVYD